MKYLLILLIGITSCNAIVTLNDLNDPFIVQEIEQISESHSMYTDLNEVDFTHKSKNDNQSIILPNGLYNIGDTIYFYKFHAQPLKK